MRDVDLNLVALRRPAFVLPGGMEINAAVASRRSFNFRFENEILELASRLKQVAARAVDHNLAILGDDLSILAQFPAIQILAVEELNPFSVLGVRPRSE